MTCPWPDSRTCSHRRGPSSAPQGLFMGVKYCYGPRPIFNHGSWDWENRGYIPLILACGCWGWEQQHREHRLLYLIILCSALRLPRGFNLKNHPWVQSIIACVKMACICCRYVLKMPKAFLDSDVYKYERRWSLDGEYWSRNVLAGTSEGRWVWMNWWSIWLITWQKRLMDKWIDG